MSPSDDHGQYQDLLRCMATTLSLPAEDVKNTQDEFLDILQPAGPLNTTLPIHSALLQPAHPPHTCLQQCLSLLENMATCISITPYAHLYMRCFRLWLCSVYDPEIDHVNKRVLLPPSVLTSFSWLCNLSKVMAGILFNSPTSHTTDVSLVGWGAHIKGHMTQGL